jgi:hypothetical protein
MQNMEYKKGLEQIKTRDEISFKTLVYHEKPENRQHFFNVNIKKLSHETYHINLIIEIVDYNDSFMIVDGFTDDNRFMKDLMNSFDAIIRTLGGGHPRYGCSLFFRYDFLQRTDAIMLIDNNRNLADKYVEYLEKSKSKNQV